MNVILLMFHLLGLTTLCASNENEFDITNTKSGYCPDDWVDATFMDLGKTDKKIWLIVKHLHFLI